MTDEPSSSDPEAGNRASGSQRAEARAAEAAAIRRRWVTLGEILAVIAVIISGLTLWNSWNERGDTEATRTAEAQRASTRAATLVLTATASDGALALKPTSPDQSVQSQTITFPTALGVAPAETTGEPRIEAAWFERALKRARDTAGLPDDSRGDERLPVAISTRFVVDGQTHEDVALYDIGYSIAGRWLGGHSVTLRGLSLVSRTRRGDTRALDARWSRLFAQK